MGLIRSGQTTLTPMDDDKLTDYLWPIVREMIKTAIENKQNLIVEGCYIPFDWQKDFAGEYLENIRYTCLILSRPYIENHFGDVQKYANVIESRLDDSDLNPADLIAENEHILLFVEVKTRRQDPNIRSPFGRPSDAVNLKKRKNVADAAEAYLCQHPSKKFPRIDVVEVYISPNDPPTVLRINWFKNAFGAGGQM